MPSLYAVEIVPVLDEGVDGLTHTVCVTDVWDIAVDAAQYCVESYPVRYAEYRVELSNHANARVYARWHVINSGPNAPLVLDGRVRWRGFLDAQDRAETAQ